MLEAKEDTSWVATFGGKVCAECGLPRPNRIEVKGVQRGRFRTKTNIITLPTWIFKRGGVFAMAYLIHELCHGVIMGHGYDFRMLERSVLKKYGITAIYSRAYTRKLFFHGELAYDRNDYR